MSQCQGGANSVPTKVAGPGPTLPSPAPAVPPPSPRFPHQLAPPVETGRASTAPTVCLAKKVPHCSDRCTAVLGPLAQPEEMHAWRCHWQLTPRLIPQLHGNHARMRNENLQHRTSMTCTIDVVDVVQPSPSQLHRLGSQDNSYSKNHLFALK